MVGIYVKGNHQPGSSAAKEKMQAREETSTVSCDCGAGLAAWLQLIALQQDPRGVIRAGLGPSSLPAPAPLFGVGK